MHAYKNPKLLCLFWTNFVIKLKKITFQFSSQKKIWKGEKERKKFFGIKTRLFNIWLVFAIFLKYLLPLSQLSLGDQSSSRGFWFATLSYFQASSFLRQNCKTLLLQKTFSKMRELFIPRIKVEKDFWLQCISFNCEQ